MKAEKPKSALRWLYVVVPVVLLVGAIVGGVLWQESRCDHGAGEVCFALGLSAERGSNHVKANPEAAASYYKKACEAGSMRGCNALGNAYTNGYGVGSNLDKASEYHQRACQGGFAAACVQ